MRLLTRADWDGLVCAVLLGKAETLDEILFAHPKDMQDGQVAVPPDTIVANLPYHPQAAVWFDHHFSTQTPAPAPAGFRGCYAPSPSAAHLIYDYYGGEQTFPHYAALVEITDRITAARLTREDVLHPAGYILLSYTIDPRTSLPGRHQPYFLKLVELVQSQPLDEILQHPEVKARCEQVFRDEALFREMLLRHSRQEQNVVLTDFRGLKDLPAGNRFLVYVLFPAANISVRIFDGRGGQFVVLAIGHSIFNRTARVNVGALLQPYGGGGGQRVGAVQLPLAEADAKIAEIISRLKA